MENPGGNLCHLKWVIVVFAAAVTFETHLASGRTVLVMEPLSWRSSREGLGESGCGGAMGKGCLWEAEAEMDSEISRRVLMGQRRYISYGSLERDKVPCSTPGAPYYNCRGQGRGNSYSRGCEVITGCAREVGF